MDAEQRAVERSVRAESVERWCRAGEARDAGAAAAVLSADVRLVSPLTDRFAFVGRDRVRDLLDAALTSFDDLRYTGRVAEGDTAVLFAEGAVGGVRFEEVQRLRLDPSGLVCEVRPYLRPLPALTALMHRLGPRLARRDGRPVLARLLPLASGVLHGMAASGERRIMPLAAPR